MKIHLLPLPFLFFCSVWIGAEKAQAQQTPKPEIKKEETDYLPKKMALWIGGFGDSFNVLLKGKTLEYTNYGFGGGAPKKHKIITPTKEQWRKFWKALDDIKIWQWQARYDVDVVDGTSWSLEIEQSGAKAGKIKSEGDNGYPLSIESLEKMSIYPTPIYKKYLAAVQALIGKETFE